MLVPGAEDHRLLTCPWDRVPPPSTVILLQYMSMSNTWPTARLDITLCTLSVLHYM